MNALYFVLCLWLCAMGLLIKQKDLKHKMTDIFPKADHFLFRQFPELLAQFRILSTMDYLYKDVLQTVCVIITLIILLCFSIDGTQNVCGGGLPEIHHGYSPGK